VDPHCFDADPDPDPAQNLDADPDPDPDPAKNVHPPWQNPRYAPESADLGFSPTLSRYHRLYLSWWQAKSRTREYRAEVTGSDRVRVFARRKQQSDLELELIGCGVDACIPGSVKPVEYCGSVTCWHGSRSADPCL
jgi:hypothetical protein